MLRFNIQQPPSMSTTPARLDVGVGRKLSMSWFWQAFGGCIDHHRPSAAVLDFDLTALRFIAGVMTLDVDVLGATVVDDGVLGHLDARLVVFENHQLGTCSTGRSQNLAQQTMHPLAFLDRQTECDVLGFAR